MASESGTIHKARASFTVVPTARATAPNLAVAPTTESRVMNCQCCPEAKLGLCEMQDRADCGERQQRDGVEHKSVPREIAISSSVALAMGPTAAIALPPQIAVPAEIKNEATRPPVSIAQGSSRSTSQPKY